MKSIKNYLNLRKNLQIILNVKVSDEYSIKYNVTPLQLKSYSTIGTCIKLKRKQFDPIITLFDKKEKKFPYLISIPLSSTCIQSITKVKSNSFFGKGNNKYYIKNNLWEK